MPPVAGELGPAELDADDELEEEPEDVECEPPLEQGVQVGTATQEVEPPTLDPLPLLPVCPPPPTATADPLPVHEYSGGADCPLLTLSPA